LAAGLPLLQEASEDARESGYDPWEFALTGRALLAAGLNENDLRWLVSRGLVDHAAEEGRAAPGRRAFRPAPDLSIGEWSCFVLTAGGARFIAEGLRAGGLGHGPSARPRWDAGARELTWQGGLVKRFQNPARCQELILAAFEEEGWPVRIDDP